MRISHPTGRNGTRQEVGGMHLQAAPARSSRPFSHGPWVKLRYPQCDLDVTICDFKLSSSSLVNFNPKCSENYIVFLMGCSFNAPAFHFRQYPLPSNYLSLRERTAKVSTLMALSSSSVQNFLPSIWTNLPEAELSVSLAQIHHPVVFSKGVMFRSRLPSW